MYIEQAFKYLHEWWRYLVGLLIIILASQVGSLPFIIALAFKVFTTGGDFDDLRDPNVMMTILESNLTLFLLLMSFAVGLLGVYFVVRYLHKQPFIALTTTRRKTDWGRVFFGFGLVFVLNIILTGMDYFYNPESYEVQFNLVPFLILVAIVLVMMPLQTSFEEYLFRGYLMQGLGVITKNRWFPLLTTSILFGLLHISNPEVGKLGYITMVFYIGTGLLLGIMTLMDEGMELALGFHAGNNIIAALLVTSDWSVFKTHAILKDISEPSAGVAIVAPVLIVYPIFLLLMARRYNWTNWQEKLFGKVEKPELPIHQIDEF